MILMPVLLAGDFDPLVSLETFIAVQEISGHRFGSRSSSGANTRHPDTRRSYLLRTYLFCDLCGRRCSARLAAPRLLRLRPKEGLLGCPKGSGHRTH